VPHRILIVDDDPTLLRLLGILLREEGFDVIAADSGEQALAQLDLAPADLVLSDLRMGGMDGLALFEAVRKRFPALPVIILTAHGTIPDAVDATRRGVFGFIPKPYEQKTLLAEVRRALEHVAVAGGGTYEDSQIITRNAPMIALLGEARMVAGTEASVLILGPTGSGKELLAQTIHDWSPRARKPFVAINCGAIPEQLLESELFGHVKGSFTGATRDHAGLFQEADGGTLFLDEIGDMPTPLQVKLLRVLQQREVRPIGSVRAVPVDVRVVSATHRDLHDEIEAKRFREDLYYRLNVVSLALPALAERREDVPVLASHFIATLAEKYRKPVQGFAPEALEALVRAGWPGNVRQLFNVVEKCVALCPTALVPMALVERALDKRGGGEEMESLEEARRGFEREYLVRLLKMMRGNVAAAARVAKRNRSDFYTLMKRHDLDPGRFKAG
jgi:two-component system response regulator GlrR